MTPVLELDKITCRHADGRREVSALDDVSLSITADELVAVMGPSGSGKSTLVHVSCGLVVPTSGAVRIGGESVPFIARPWWATRRRRDVGVVHQRLNLVPGLTALENVALPLELDGWSVAVARAAAHRALDEAGADDLAGLPSRDLSLGEQQRVAIARAIVGERKLVLADEPTAALDSAGAEAVVRLLADLAHAGRAVLLVTHDSRLAAWADRLVVLRDGRIVDSIGAQPADARPGSVERSGSADASPVVGA
jgi:putative ABC transport system ATP-binding protein